MGSFCSSSSPCCCPHKASQPPAPEEPPYAQPPQPSTVLPTSFELPVPTKENSTSLFQTINNAGDVDYLIHLIDDLLNRSKQEKTLEGTTSSEPLSDTLKAGDGNREAVAQILQSVEKACWMVGGLSLVAFLLDQIELIPENQSEYIELLRQMFKLAIKHNFVVEGCTQIFEALERGKDVIEENLSRRLFTNVYNELEASTQEAFLDICCFFASWSRRDVECIVGAEDLTHLEEAALFKTSDKDNVIVLDIFRAKGLSMSESNRITSMQSWLDVCDNKRFDQIKGIWLTREESEPALGGNMSGLWPVNLESLERLAVYHGPVYKDGVTLCKARPSPFHLPKKLQVTKATVRSEECAKSQKSMPANVIQNSFLEELDLKELRTLQRLTEWLDHLTRLKVLILDEWDKMQELSEQICERFSLCKLSICGGSFLQNLPKTFGQLSSLQELILTSCNQLEELPSSFGDLSSLKHLNLAVCVNLKELPSSFGKLNSLESDDIKELPSSFGDLASLVELRCNGLELKELPVSFGQLISLTRLDLSCCMKLKSLPSSAGELMSLKHFNLSSCFKIEVLPSNIGGLPCLTELDFRLCNSFREFPTSRNYQQLTIWLPEKARKREYSSN
ncbi:hypothetical protein SUGI_0856810 [Cryptomeria japonica]|nr:hypothetical protein SUGI_0856810 [Cryptomeria japonica]